MDQEYKNFKIIINHKQIKPRIINILGLTFISILNLIATYYNTFCSKKELGCSNIAVK